ncbi:hypothetical protein GCM10009836_69080 [Pseudonocardia ailaonensis]|uniref:DUF2742 domain-containing protein n=1 Tax=Pseudonocardia ailaonensis TaxID=367279 RepID=A0ABN2NNM0_9PSEU
MNPIPVLIDPSERIVVAHKVATPIINATRDKYGELVPMTLDAWCRAPDDVKIASLLTLALAWLVSDPVGRHRATMSEISDSVSAAHNWSWTATEPSYAELKRRRDWGRQAAEREAVRAAAS